MNKHVELPLSEPLYSTYHYQGNGCAMLTENPSIKNWYLNRVMNLRCSRRIVYGCTSPFISVNDSSADDNPYIEKIWLKMQYLGSDVHRIIRRFLDNGYYVAFDGIDDYYVKGKSWYHEHHFTHDGMICGYDQNNRTYTVYAYDSSWIYKPFQTPQRCLEEGRKASFAEGYYGSICGMKVKPDIVEIDPSEICTCLKEYMSSSLDNYPVYSDGMAYGTAVHDYIAMYVNKLADMSVPYKRTDQRVFRMLWEHKKVMLERILAVEDKLHMNREISSQYSDIVKEADILRMIYAFHLIKPRFSILHTIRDRLIAIKQSEEKLLLRFIKKTEEVIKT